MQEDYFVFKTPPIPVSLALKILANELGMTLEELMKKAQEDMEERQKWNQLSRLEKKKELDILIQQIEQKEG